MKAAVILILLMGIFLGFWLIFELIRYKQGAKIKAYLDHQMDIYRSTRHYKQTQEANRLRIYRESQPEEVEVIDEGEREIVWDLVDKNGKRTPQQFVFEISNLPLAE
ncbi:MAG: hypothetical protein OQK82_05655 [Candidatus Pacearchaeota archaeon]|nr:hypothetical protein [Candidatus Pacearchaeota archaeon]